jgi:hypothetical protein
MMGIASATTLALVDERSEVLGECRQAEGKRQLLGQVEAEGQRGNIHREHLACQNGGVVSPS